jgi:hypothetical protein
MHHGVLESLVIGDLKVSTRLIIVKLYQTGNGYNNERLDEVAPEHDEDSPNSAKDRARVVVTITD